MMNDKRNGTIKLVDVCKYYGDRAAVDHIDLSVRSGEFFALLGPSGCGKTTTLRMIAGFEMPDVGQIMLDGRDVSNDPPHRRPVNTVFQSYALFPHLNVFENVAFGLKRLKIKHEELRKRVTRALEMIEMNDFIEYRPIDLSGGQKQRVALARALALQPAALLLDEPMGALDAKLRRTLQGELRTLQQELGITFIYVTHDQNEALTMSDRIAVMRDGHIQQVGSPQEIYERPANVFVADFLGASNLLDIQKFEKISRNRCHVTVGNIAFDATFGEYLDLASTNMKASIRPERIKLLNSTVGECGQNQTNGTIQRIIYLGKSLKYCISLDIGGQIEAEIHIGSTDTVFETGDCIRVHFPTQDLSVLC